MIGLRGHFNGERATVLSNFLLYIKKKKQILQEGRKPLGVGTNCTFRERFCRRMSIKIRGQCPCYGLIVLRLTAYCNIGYLNFYITQSMVVVNSPPPGCRLLNCIDKYLLNILLSLEYLLNILLSFVLSKLNVLSAGFCWPLLHHPLHSRESFLE